MKSSFGSKELIKCLEHLHYTAKPQVGSRHHKYYSPNLITKGQCPFIIVIQNRSIYDPYWQREYIKQIIKHGFTKETVTNAMRK